MRLAIDLPDELVNKALSLFPRNSESEVIVAALEEFVRKKRLLEIKKYRGKVDLEIDLDTLRKRGV